MFARSLAFVVWAAVAGSAVFWGFKLFVRPLAVPAQAVVAVPAVAGGGDLSRLFGAEPPPVVAEAAAPAPESARFQLIGVVAPRAAAANSQGLALIAVDGKLPRAYRVGAVIDGEQVLQSVQARGAAIGPRNGAVTVALELPALPPPATGVPGPSATPPNVPGVPGMPSFAPAPVPTPFQPGVMPQGAPNFGSLPQARLRALRNLGSSTGLTPAVPGMAAPVEGNAEVPVPHEPMTNQSPRNQR